MAELSHEQFAAKHLKSRIEKIVARLGDLTETVEREALAVERGPRSYAAAAADVQHAVLWGLANLSLDALVNAAADADRGRIEDRQAAGGLTDEQLHAVRALLSLVHYDELATSWLKLLPASFRPEAWQETR